MSALEILCNKKWSTNFHGESAIVTFASEKGDPDERNSDKMKIEFQTEDFGIFKYEILDVRIHDYDDFINIYFYRNNEKYDFRLKGDNMIWRI